MDRHKRSINAFMAMAAALSLRLRGLLQTQHVNEGCLNSVKSTVETPAKALDRGNRGAKSWLSSIFIQRAA
jgi:hypothetical protein